MSEFESTTGKLILAKNVHYGKNCLLGMWVELGHPPRGYEEGELSLIMGDGAVIRSRTVIYAGTTIGNNFSTGHGALIREGVTIGDNVSIGSGSEISQRTVIGNNVRIHSNCFIAENTVIEDDVRIAPGTITADAKHPLLPEEQKNRKGPHIKRGAYIGIGVKLLPHVVIGEGSFIGAGAIVTKDIPAGVVAMGSPARVYMGIDEYLARLV